MSFPLWLAKAIPYVCSSVEPGWSIQVNETRLLSAALLTVSLNVTPGLLLRSSASIKRSKLFLTIRNPLVASAAQLWWTQTFICITLLVLVGVIAALKSGITVKVVSLDETEKSENINTFGKQLAMHIAASNPIALNSDDIDKDIIDKEQQLITEELKNSGKPVDIAKKISIGKLNKFKEENSLMTQDWVMEPKKKVKDVLSEISKKNIKINEFIRFKIGE